jgi:predicted alpha/beta-fold hydrolase
MATHAPEFLAPRWLRSAHAQTIYASRFCPQPPVAYRRERWDTPDADFIDVDFLAAPAGSAAAPWLVLLHGLEGNSDSHYARTLMQMAAQLGWHGAVPHFRGCSGEPNWLPRAYHSGDTPEVDWILRRFAGHAAGAPLYVVGVSLGGNVLMKWAAEQGMAATRVIDAAISVCAPVDLHAAGTALEQGFARIYTVNFLRTLKRKAAAKLVRFPGIFDPALLRQVRTMRAFDDVFTAPLHGYRDVDDYWTRASCKPGLGAVAVPSLMINALDDPFLPACALPGRHEVSSRVTLDYPRTGGHVGFVGGGLPGQTLWLARRVAHFLGVTVDGPGARPFHEARAE